MGAQGFRRRLAGAMAALALGATPLIAADTAPSTSLASQLAGVMGERKLQAIAAQDPSDPERYVAALFFPGVQLLVVAGKPTAPDALRADLDAAQYANVYSALHGAVVPDSKLFVQDLNADGLRAHEKDAVDIVYDRVVNQLIFDGAPRKRRLTDEQYDTQFSSADAQYSRLLAVLIAALKIPAPPH